MTESQSWYVVLLQAQVNVGVPCKCSSLSTLLFLLALGQITANFWNCFVLKQIGLSATQSPPSFIYIHLLSLEQRSSQEVYKEAASQRKFFLMSPELWFCRFSLSIQGLNLRASFQLPATISLKIRHLS